MADLRSGSDVAAAMVVWVARWLDLVVHDGFLALVASWRRVGMVVMEGRVNCKELPHFGTS